jgi:hypothetical protein
MQLSLAQILLLVVVLFFIVSAVKKYKGKVLLVNELIMTIIFWLLAGVVIVLPSLTQKFANLIGIGRGVDLMIYISLLAIFYFVFYLLGRQRETDERLTKLTREIAIMNANKNNDKARAENVKE